MNLTDKHFFADMQIKKNTLPDTLVGGVASSSTLVEQERLTEYIAMYEKRFIVKFLGDDVLKALNDNPQPENLVNLIYGEGEYPESFLANFIYYHAAVATLNNVVDKGSAAEHSAAVKNFERAAEVWNRGIEICAKVRKQLKKEGFCLSDEKPLMIRWYDMQ